MESEAYSPMIENLTAADEDEYAPLAIGQLVPAATDSDASDKR